MSVIDARLQVAPTAEQLRWLKTLGTRPGAWPHPDTSRNKDARPAHLAPLHKSRCSRQTPPLALSKTLVAGRGLRLWHGNAVVTKLERKATESSSATDQREGRDWTNNLGNIAQINLANPGNPQYLSLLHSQFYLLVILNVSDLCLDQIQHWWVKLFFFLTEWSLSDDFRIQGWNPQTEAGVFVRVINPVFWFYPNRRAQKTFNVLLKMSQKSSLSQSDVEPENSKLLAENTWRRGTVTGLLTFSL